MRVNAGIGKGNARGTALGQYDCRANVWQCGNCSALVEAHWARRKAKAARRELQPHDGCARCSPAYRRRTYVDNQRAMADELAAGLRRLVQRHGLRAEREWIELPSADVLLAVEAARAQAAAEAALAKPRGRPRRRAAYE